MIKKSVVGRVDALLKTDLFSSVGKDKLVPICENHCQNKTFQKVLPLFPNCQKATALAAATFRESTPWDMGIRTV